MDLLPLRRLLNRNLPLHVQLERLAECGIGPNEGIGTAELLKHFAERQYETSPFKRLLVALGNLSDEPPGTPLSDNVWHAQAGCISGPGDYVRVANRMASLAGGALPLSDVWDEFGVGREFAWLRFRLGDEQFHWRARIEERWLDPSILSRFVTLLETQDTHKRYTVLDLGGQDWLIACSTPQQYTMLRRYTGLNFEWLA